MGLRYRKSMKLPGGFRVNLSKSGVGYSWGVKGYRVTKTAKGTTRTTTSIPGTGLSHVKESGGKSASRKSSASSDPAPEGKRSGCLPRIVAIPLVVLLVLGALSSLTKPKDKSVDRDIPSQASASVAPTMQPVEEMADSAKSILSKTFQMDLIGFEKTDMLYEMTATIEGVSDREDQTEAPEGWQDTQRMAISASATVRDTLELPNNKISFSIEDLSGDIMLTVQNGRIVFDKYAVEPTPEPTPEPTNAVESQRPTTSSGNDRTVWISSSGKRYHYSSSCSNMGDPRSVTLSSAIAQGYTPCSKCT